MMSGIEIVIEDVSQVAKNVLTQGAADKVAI
jgi:hypothetical protein